MGTMVELAAVVVVVAVAVAVTVTVLVAYVGAEIRGATRRDGLGVVGARAES